MKDKNINVLSKEVEYIIIQEENPNNIEDTTRKIIAKITPYGIEIADGYMIRTKLKKIKKNR